MSSRTVKNIAAYWSGRLRRVDPLAAVLTYDAPPALNRAYDRWERTSLRRILPKSMMRCAALDIGCGTGRITVELAKAGAQVTAVDISPEMLQACHGHARRARVAARVTTLECPAGELPHDLGKFDLITCFGLLEHLPHGDRRRCLTAALANLKKSGRLLLVVNNSGNAYLNQQKKRRGGIKGHFVTMVGLEWLEKECHSLDARMTVKAANPFYAWLHYVVWGQQDSRMSDRELSRLARLVERLDLAFPLNGPLPQILASHFMVEVRCEKPW